MKTSIILSSLALILLSVNLVLHITMRTQKSVFYKLYFDMDSNHGLIVGKYAQSEFTWNIRDGRFIVVHAKNWKSL